MTKRRLERELESLSVEVMLNLSPTERINLFASALAEDNQIKVKQLRKTIPRRTLQGSDPAYRNAARVATSLSEDATYGLHMSYLQYQLATERAERRLLESQLSAASTADASDEAEVAELFEVLEQNRTKTGVAAAELYIEYHANRRFAEECLEVTLEEFLALSPAGWYADVDFSAVVAAVEESGDLPETVTRDDDGDTEELSLEEGVQWLYDEIVQRWDDRNEELKP